MDQAIGGRPAKQEVLDKRRSLQNPSGNLLDIHRDHQSGQPGDPEVAGPRCHVDGLPGGAMEQRGRGMDPRRSATASCQAGDGGAGEQDGAHRLGVDDARRGLPGEGTDRGRGGSRGVMAPREMVGVGREPD